MSKQNIDWSNLGFGYIKTDYRYVCRYKDGQWDEGGLETDANITLNECACVFQYCQACFEGMKAYYTKDGHIVCFRPDMNAKRMADSAARLEMPPFPVDKFVDAEAGRRGECGFCAAVWHGREPVHPSVHDWHKQRHRREARDGV